MLLCDIVEDISDITNNCCLPKTIIKMENGQKSISDLFESRRIFNIPKYQRAYAWEQKQLQDFISDLDNQTLGKDYFLGTILLQVQNSEGLFKIIDIVDGQQRLTTLTIFIRLLLEKLESGGDDISILWETYVKYRNEYKLRVLEYDHEFFCNCILEECEEAENLIQTPSQRRLLQAKTFFVNDLEKRSVENLRELREKIEKAKVLTYAVTDNAEATLIFETTNDRGKPLTNLEQIKSFLMYKIYIAADKPEEYLRIIQERFGEIYRDYEDTLINWNLEENTILRNHYIAFELDINQKQQKDYSNHILLIKDRINSLTSNSTTLVKATKFINKYSLELKETFSIINALSKKITGDFRNLFNLNRTSNFLPLLIVSMKHDNSQDHVHFCRVIKLLEIISFRVYGIRKRKLNNQTILNHLYYLSQTFAGDFHNLILALKNIIAEFCSDREFKERLTSSKFYEDISRNDINYLLWQYENYLRRTEYQEDSSIRFRKKYNSFSIEHIIPQNPREISSWMNENNLINYVNCIGNLTLDTSGENSSKSNLSFDIKYKHFYQLSRFRCQQELMNFKNLEKNEWDVSSVIKRQEKILNFAMDYWDYKNI